MPLGQGWLNAWVKVNQKHVVLNSNEKGEAGSSSHSSTKEEQTKCSKCSSVTAPTIDSESNRLAHLQLQQRKTRKRIQKTVSATDLLREKARNGDEGNGSPETALDKSSSTRATSNQRKPSNEEDHHELVRSTVSQHEGPGNIIAVEEEGSLRFVAGFFGTDLESLAHSRGTGPRGEVSVHGPVQRPGNAETMSRGGKSLPVRSRPAPRRLNREESNDVVSRSGGFLPNLFSQDPNRKCTDCRKLEAELIATQEDLEYLRSVSIRSEYICRACKSETSLTSHKQDLSSSSVAYGSTDWLHEVTARHKSQIEQMTKERHRWQHDTHVKLQKYAALCKDLNEEASARNEEALSLHEELDATRCERDSLATELESAKALIATYERNQVESDNAIQRVREAELKRMDTTESAIATRDNIIDELELKLEKALDLLKLERDQQKKRRHIFFPQLSTSKPTHQCNEHDSESSRGREPER